MKNNLAVFPVAIIHGAVAADRPAVHVEIIHLPREKIIRLGKNSCVESVEVKNGMVWLTATPANGDVLLSSGEQFELRDNWPFVIQALEATKLSLNRAVKSPARHKTK